MKKIQINNKYHNFSQTHQRVLVAGQTSDLKPKNGQSLPLRKMRHVHLVSPVADRTSLQAEEMVREDGPEEIAKEIMAEIFQK